MKPWIWVSLLSLSFSAWSVEVEFKAFSQVNQRHQEEVGKFCEQLKSLGIRSPLFTDNCDLVAKEISLVYNKVTRELISVLEIQFVRNRTTALISGSFLVDFSQVADIYYAMFAEIRLLSYLEESWKDVSWVAIHREILNLIPELDEKQFPILFSHEEQFFAASLISNIPQKNILQTLEVCESSNYGGVFGVALLGVVIPVTIYQILRSY
ncbi:MAG: hypothetical protein WCK49_07665 [Myxococcaceae bacterium]